MYGGESGDVAKVFRRWLYDAISKATLTTYWRRMRQLPTDGCL